MVTVGCFLDTSIDIPQRLFVFLESGQGEPENMVEASVSGGDLESLSKPAISLRVPPTDAVEVREIHVGSSDPATTLGFRSSSGWPASVSRC